jgi:hypothetical protein
LFLAVRGLPALLFYRRDLPMRERVQMVMLTATTLPMLVALAKIGLESGTMLSENAAALVGAGVLTVIVFPATAVGLGRKTSRPLEQARQRLATDRFRSPRPPSRGYPARHSRWLNLTGPGETPPYDGTRQQRRRLHVRSLSSSPARPQATRG